MGRKLKDSPQIWKLARDLGLRPGLDPATTILEFCRRKVRKIAKELECKRLSDLLGALAASLGTTFVEIHSDADLKATQEKYLSMGEKAFATVDGDLGADVLAITFRRIRRRNWEPLFVSLIDCRGEKAARSYYSKWHELAHLLTLTDQLRLSFTRTHSQASEARDPEERLMEVIAGTFGFWEEMLALDGHDQITFDLIDQLRTQLCPDASAQASTIGFVKAWPRPCILIEASLAAKQGQRVSIAQQSLGFAPPPKLDLRAVSVASSELAKDRGMRIYKNMRIPECSIIHRVFYDGLGNGKAVENLRDWTTSDGGGLAGRSVTIQARRSWRGVDALITPM